jgi:predicted nucleic acid-binding protein
VICVVDASLTLAWLFREEHSRASDQLLERVAEEGAVVPSLWRLETANALQIALRRKRIDAEFRDLAFKSLRNLPIEVDDETDMRAWTDTLRLSDQHGLTLYDAAYLELALRRSLPLAALDRALVEAARKSGARVLPGI